VAFVEPAAEMSYKIVALYWDLERDDQDHWELGRSYYCDLQ